MKHKFVLSCESTVDLPFSKDVRICDIGTSIASHCGPGTVAVFFLGSRRELE